MPNATVATTILSSPHMKLFWTRRRSDADKPAWYDSACHFRGLRIFFLAKRRIVGLHENSKRRRWVKEKEMKIKQRECFFGNVIQQLSTTCSSCKYLMQSFCMSSLDAINQNDGLCHPYPDLSFSVLQGCVVPDCWFVCFLSTAPPAGRSWAAPPHELSPLFWCSRRWRSPDNQSDHLSARWLKPESIKAEERERKKWENCKYLKTDTFIQLYELQINMLHTWSFSLSVDTDRYRLEGTAADRTAMPSWSVMSRCRAMSRAVDSVAVAVSPSKHCTPKRSLSTYKQTQHIFYVLLSFLKRNKQSPRQMGQLIVQDPPSHH